MDKPDFCRLLTCPSGFFFLLQTTSLRMLLILSESVLFAAMWFVFLARILSKPLEPSVCEIILVLFKKSG